MTNVSSRTQQSTNHCSMKYQEKHTFYLDKRRHHKHKGSEIRKRDGKVRQHADHVPQNKPALRSEDALAVIPGYNAVGCV